LKGARGERSSGGALAGGMGGVSSDMA
jgi:hypothetical protein